MDQSPLVIVGSNRFKFLHIIVRAIQKVNVNGIFRIIRETELLYKTGEYSTSRRSSHKATELGTTFLVIVS